MADEPENLTIHILQEMREDIRRIVTRVDEGFAEQSNRANGNTILLNMVAGLLHDHEERLTKLEG